MKKESFLKKVYKSFTKKPKKRVTVIAHRGFSGSAPENTLSAFKKAIDLGADMIEFDIMLTKDGIPVVFHDYKLSRTTNGKGKLTDFTLEELKLLDAGSWFKPEFAGEKIPTLEEVLLLSKGKIKLNIEIKGKAVKRKIKFDGIEEKAVRLVEKYEMLPEVIFSSFKPIALKRIKELSPDASVALLERAKIINFSVRKAKSLNSLALNHDKRLLNNDIVKKAHAIGLKINIYTVNKKPEMKKFIKKNVDGIFTDYPDKLIEVMKEMGIY